MEPTPSPTTVKRRTVLLYPSEPGSSDGCSEAWPTREWSVEPIRHQVYLRRVAELETKVAWGLTGRPTGSLPGSLNSPASLSSWGAWPYQKP